jgi:hypothetical protein
MGKINEWAERKVVQFFVVIEINFYNESERLKIRKAVILIQQKEKIVLTNQFKSK